MHCRARVDNLKGKVGGSVKLVLIEEQTRQTIYKNTATSYGLTLVIGLPFPAAIRKQIQNVQNQLDALAPGRFTWYGTDHLH